MKSFLRVILALWVLAAVAQACDFKYDPASAQLLYRSEGWKLPLIDQGKLSAPVNFTGSYPSGFNLGPRPISGLTVRAIIHDPSEAESNRFQVPRQEFERDGKHGVMSSQSLVFDHHVWRYDVDGRVVAYTFGFTPVWGHWDKGEWKQDGELACTFDVTFIDDKGDGVFRVLLPGWITTDQIPQWVLDSKKNPT